MPPRAVALEAILHARLEATRELLLGFEASVVRLPPDLRTAVRTLRRIAEETQARLPATLRALPKDPQRRSEQESVYVAFVRKLWRRAAMLTIATSDPELPQDLVALMRLHLTQPEDLPLILRASSGVSYESFPWGDPITRLEEAWVSADASKPPRLFDVTWRPHVLAFIEIPHTLARSTFLHLIALGHELAHLQDELVEQRQAVGDQHGHVARALLEITIPQDVPANRVEQWADELFADIVSVRRYGPAAAFALAEFSELMSAFQSYTESHPPSDLRMSVVVEELKPFLGRKRSGQPLTRAAYRALDSYKLSARQMRALAPAEYRGVVETVLKALPALRKAAGALAPNVYSAQGGVRVEELAVDFARGIARSDQIKDANLQTTPETVADLFNAVAVVRHSSGARTLATAMTGRSSPTEREVAAALSKLDDLLAHSLAGVHLAQEWRDVQGQPSPPAPGPGSPRRAPAARAILAPQDIRRRLASPKATERIVVTPLLDPSVSHGTLDVRLGREFIAFRKTRYLGVDPIAALRDAAQAVEKEERELQQLRAMRGLTPIDQRISPELLERRSQDELSIRVGRTVERIFVPFRETFVLHPHQLVLACTLEYVCLPEDIGAYVLSRSSIGRLGILSATATFIHPRFSGAVTLELVNTSETPVRITPGMRIAQLVFEHADPAAGEPTGRYQFSTRPEIALLTSDRELQRLAQAIHQET